MRLFILISLLWSLPSQATTYDVTRFDDPAPDGCEALDCSLREAVIAANTNPGSDTIALGTGTYYLAIEGSGDQDADGDLDVTEDLHVIGNNKDQTTINAGGVNFLNRVFDIKIDVHFKMSELSIRNAILAFGELNGAAVRITEASAEFHDVQIEDCETINGGAVAALFSDIEFYQSTLSNNEARDFGGAIYMLQSTLIFHDSRVQYNIASGFDKDGGGGIYAEYIYATQANPAIKIEHSLITDNTTGDSGGGLHLTSSTQGLVEVEVYGSQVTGNAASNHGGGLYQTGNFNIKIGASTFEDNFSNNASGGGLYKQSGDLQIEHSLFSGNGSEDRGGGLYSADSTSVLDILNSTFSGNSAQNAGAMGGYGTFNLNHVTAIANTTQLTGDINFYSPGTIQNSVVSGDCETDTSLSSLGGNIESPGNTCGLGSGANDIVDLYPRLLGISKTLANNGGPTMSHRIFTTSSLAVGNAIPIPGVTVDQRYFSRDSEPDSGATEQHPDDYEVIFKNGFE